MSNTATTNAEPEPQGPTANDAQHLVDGVARVLTKPRFKPRFRGWIHVYSAGAAVFAGASLVAVSWAVNSTRAGQRRQKESQGQRTAFDTDLEPVIMGRGRSEKSARRLPR